MPTTLLRTTLLALAITLLAPVIATAHDPTAGAPPFIVGGEATVVVDGVFDAAEWANAGTLVESLPMPPGEGGGTRKAPFYFANDAENLYLGLRIALAPDTRVSFAPNFDNEHATRRTN